jgi:hypothetical protein
MSTAAEAQTKGKGTAAKERAAGTTVNSGNNCYGGSYSNCVAYNTKVGWSNNQAARHCARTCAK